LFTVFKVIPRKPGVMDQTMIRPQTDGDNLFLLGYIPDLPLEILQQLRSFGLKHFFPRMQSLRIPGFSPGVTIAML
jgi:hypothetical protein